MKDESGMRKAEGGGMKDETVRLTCDEIFFEAYADAEHGLKVIQLTPDGLVKSTRGEFVVDEESARLVREAFEAHGNDLPIDYEHQTLGGEYSSPSGQAPAAGWIKEIIYSKAAGLFAMVQWTEQGKELIRDGHYRYLSPVAIIRKSDRKLIEIHSAALTNKPAIPRMERLAAKRDSNVETKVMSDIPETTGGDPGILIGEIKALLGIGDIEDETNINSVLRAIRDALKAKGGDGESKEGEGGAAEVAASARKALGLSTAADGAAVVTAINTLKGGLSGAKELETKVNALTEKLAQRDAEDLLRPYEAKGVVRRDDPKDWEIFANMARQTPEDCKHLLDQRVALLPMSGPTTAPRRSQVTGGNEDELIANALKEHDGNYGNAMVALQSKLVAEECEQTGMERKHVVKNMEGRYPKIFVAAA